MPVTLTTPAVERSTYAITASFTDDAGLAVVPNAATLTWTLLKKVGTTETVVNSRLNVPITSAATVTIVLSDADLAIVEGESKARYLLLQGLYNSTLGSALPIKETLKFTIVNLVGVA